MAMQTQRGRRYSPNLFSPKLEEGGQHHAPPVLAPEMTRIVQQVVSASGSVWMVWKMWPTAGFEPEPSSP
jgi:hypothetical protein